MASDVRGGEKKKKNKGRKKKKKARGNKREEEEEDAEDGVRIGTMQLLLCGGSVPHLDARLGWPAASR